MKEDTRSRYGRDGGFRTPGSDYTLIWETRKFVLVQSHGVTHLLSVGGVSSQQFKAKNVSFCGLVGCGLDSKRLVNCALRVVNINCGDLDSNIA